MALRDTSARRNYQTTAVPVDWIAQGIMGRRDFKDLNSDWLTIMS